MEERVVFSTNGIEKLDTHVGENETWPPASDPSQKFTWNESSAI